MTNELTVVELYGVNGDGAPRRYTIANATAVSKGTALELTDPRTVIASTGTSAYIAGIAAEEHIPNQGVTSVSAWTDGIFEAMASGVIVVGTPIRFVENNKVASSAYNYASPSCGTAYETSVDLEVINVRVCV